MDSTVIKLFALLICLHLTHSAIPCPSTGSRDRCGPQANGVESQYKYSESCVCQQGLCCSRQGFCGPSSSSGDSQALYCGQGCQTSYGVCANTNVPTCPSRLALTPTYNIGTLTEEIASGRFLLPTAIRTSCCPLGSPIASWTIARTDDLTGYFYSGAFVGKITATCRDGTVLPAVTYGVASNGQCRTSRLNGETTIPAIQGGGTYAFRAGGILDNFLGIGGNGGYQASFSCPIQGGASDAPLTNQVAVGFQAASSCYGISSFRVLCAAAPK